MLSARGLNTLILLVCVSVSPRVFGCLVALLIRLSYSLHFRREPGPLQTRRFRRAVWILVYLMSGVEIWSGRGSTIRERDSRVIAGSALRTYYTRWHSTVRIIVAQRRYSTSLCT